MRRLALCFWLGWAAAVQAEGIADVLQRSQAARLAVRGAADAQSAAAQRVRASFLRLAALLPPTQQVEPTALMLVGGPLFAEAVFGGRAVVASESVGDLPEGERLLMLAHELGHVTLGHWAGLRGLYLQHIPGDVRPERLRVFRSCPLITPKVARSSLQMRAIARAMAVLCARARRRWPSPGTNSPQDCLCPGSAWIERLLPRRSVTLEILSASETTNPVAGMLGPQAHALSHRQEFEADAFGFTPVRALGYGVDNAFGLLTRNGVQLDSATHPATRRRLARLRLLETRLDDAPRRVGDATELAVSPTTGDRR